LIFSVFLKHLRVCRSLWIRLKIIYIFLRIFLKYKNLDLILKILLKKINFFFFILN
jgi:hypothetical protein